MEVVYKYFNVLFCHKYTIYIRKKASVTGENMSYSSFVQTTLKFGFFTNFCLTPLNKTKTTKVFLRTFGTFQVEPSELLFI